MGHFDIFKDFLVMFEISERLANLNKIKDWALLQTAASAINQGFDFRLGLAG